MLTSTPPEPPTLSQEECKSVFSWLEKNRICTLQKFQSTFGISALGGGVLVFMRDRF